MFYLFAYAIKMMLWAIVMLFRVSALALQAVAEMIGLTVAALPAAAKASKDLADSRFAVRDFEPKWMQRKRLHAKNKRIS